jgi:hypothetical protein
MYKVKIPRILYLTLDVASFYRKTFFNTNDLVGLINKYKNDLVRSRTDKKDYRYLDETKFGGIRGNLSTLLTFKGLVKRDSRISNYYSIGRDDRLVNAVLNGQIILDGTDLTANTNDEKLKNLLEMESWMRGVRETQAHVKTKLKKDKSLPLSRDSDNFKKESIFRSDSGQIFIRSLINNFIDSNNNILQFSLANLWSGKKFKKKNIHPLLVIPTKDNSWSKIYAIKNEDLYTNKPLLLNVNLEKKECSDINGNKYQLHDLMDAIKCFSKEHENLENRLDYNWKELSLKYCEKEVEKEVRKEDEFSNFLRLFLEWNPKFSIDNKDVVDVRVISSGGADVELIFSGGTKQKLELEHDWKNYIDHGHNTNSAFNNVWIFAEETLNKDKIIKTFSEQKLKNGIRIPDVFLGLNEKGERKAYRVNWDDKIFEELQLQF